MKNEYKPGRTENLKWFLEIPKINLKAEISDGTTPEILNEYIINYLFLYNNITKCLLL